LQIKSSKKANNYLRRVMGFEQEEFWVLCLTTKLQLISAKMVFLGTVDKCLVHPRDIFRYAMQENASKVMVAHSHPMAEPDPSDQDINVTHRLIQVGYLLGIPVVDHIVVARQDFYSFADQKRVCFETDESYRWDTRVS
jgi:DNA repair protein RadC